jgi:hypothetical protein
MNNFVLFSKTNCEFSSWVRKLNNTSYFNAYGKHHQNKIKLISLCYLNINLLFNLSLNLKFDLFCTITKVTQKNIYSKVILLFKYQ